MFARKVSMQLKGGISEFTQTLEREVLPLLRKQKGFRDEITFVGPAGKEAFGISLWDQAENAESYNRGAYAEVAKVLAKVIDGTPQVETYEVANSTFHKIAAAAFGLKPIGLFVGGRAKSAPRCSTRDDYKKGFRWA